MSNSIPDLCDEFGDEIDIFEPLLKSFGGLSSFSGEVETVRCYQDNTVVKATLGEDGEGKVLVVDGGGSLHCALLGDMLAKMALDNGWRGIIVNGCVRDIEILKTLPVGVLALAPHPRRSNKQGKGQRGVPLHFAGVDVLPGNFLYADENGSVISKKELTLTN